MTDPISLPGGITVFNLPIEQTLCTPTMQLRWSAAGVLQQAFINETSRNFTITKREIEWRDVPREAAA